MAKDKFRFQDSIESDPESLESGREYNKRLQQMGRRLLSGLYMLVRNVKLYDPANVIFDKPMEQMVECINTIVSMEGTLSLQCAGSSFYLNNMLVRVDVKSAENLVTLVKEMESKDIGGFILEQPVTANELRNFVFIFSSDNKETAGESGVSSRRLTCLRLRSFEKLEEILKAAGDEDEIEEEDANQSLDRKRYGLVVYARIVVFMRSFLAGLRSEAPSVPMGKVAHLLQDLVDVCHGHLTNFLGVTSVDKGEGYLPFHSVNVTMLAIILGDELGLKKDRLRELGMAALFHDVGLADISENILDKPGVLTPAENRILARAPVLGAMRLLKDNPLNVRTIQCCLASFFTGVDWGKPVKDGQGKLHHVLQTSDLGVFERIVSIADHYDRLVFQQSLDSNLALTLMNSELAHKFDPDLLRVFSHLMRGYASRHISETGQRLDLFEA